MKASMSGRARGPWLRASENLLGLTRAMRAVGLGAFGVEVERVLLDRKAAVLGDLRLAALDFGVVELLDPAAIDADEVVVVVAALSSKTALPDSKWCRSSRACSNCVSTR